MSHQLRPLIPSALGLLLLLSGCGEQAPAPPVAPDPQPQSSKGNAPVTIPEDDRSARRPVEREEPAVVEQIELPVEQIELPAEPSSQALVPHDTEMSAVAPMAPKRSFGRSISVPVQAGNGSGAFMAIGAGGGARGARGAVDARTVSGSPSGDGYAGLPENPFRPSVQDPLSTFAVDVDTASYSNIRQLIASGNRPPSDAVRIEELLNYFPYRDEQPADGRPLAVHAEVMPCPWNPTHRLARIALKAKEVDLAQLPPANLVFLVDVSGSMNQPNRLPWVQQSLRLLVDRLRATDRIAIVVYAGAAGLALPSTPGSERGKILAALDALRAGGSTAGGAGITLAYHTARQAKIAGGANRVILCTDGDFNVGVTDNGELERLIQDEARTEVFLSVLGYGRGNLKDDRMEMLADKGNGTYAYIDTLGEARKVLVEQMTGTLLTVAKDVKLQVEFNPVRAGGYRLIGYENRLLAARDFKDDRKDAGEVGAGHGVTALYELIPEGVPLPATAGVDPGPLKYQDPPTTRPETGYEWFTVKLRWKSPDGETAQQIDVPVMDGPSELAAASDDARFAAAVAGFGMLLRGSPHAGTADWTMISSLAKGSLGADPGGYRAEFLTIVAQAAALDATARAPR